MYGNNHGERGEANVYRWTDAHPALHNFLLPPVKNGKAERLTNYGSINRSESLTCLLSFHRLAKLSHSGSIPVSRRRGRGC